MSAALHPEGSYPALATLYLTVPVAVLFGGSAAYGYLSRQRCEHVKDAYQHERAIAATSR